MIYILILNVLILILEWLTGFIALKAEQPSIAVALVFIMILQLRLIYLVLLQIKNKKEPKQEEMINTTTDTKS